MPAAKPEKPEVPTGKPAEPEISSGMILLSGLAEGLQHANPAQVRRAATVLLRLVQDWQRATHSLEAQLQLSLRTIEEQGRLINALRTELQQAQAHAYEAERQLLLGPEAERGEAGDA